MFKKEDEIIAKKYSHRSKYNVKKEKPVCDGIKFDSKLEMNCYMYMRDNPSINILEFQPFFMLMKPFNYYDLEQNKTRKYGKMSYKPDFKVKLPNVDREIVVEVKGMAKPDYMMRKKLWYSQYGEDYYFLQIGSLKKCKKIFEDILNRGD